MPVVEFFTIDLEGLPYFIKVEELNITVCKKQKVYKRKTARGRGKRKTWIKKSEAEQARQQHKYDKVVKLKKSGKFVIVKEIDKVLGYHTAPKHVLKTIMNDMIRNGKPGHVETFTELTNRFTKQMDRLEKFTEQFAEEMDYLRKEGVVKFFKPDSRTTRGRDKSDN